MMTVKSMAKSARGIEYMKERHLVSLVRGQRLMIFLQASRVVVRVVDLSRDIDLLLLARGKVRARRAIVWLSQLDVL